MRVPGTFSLRALLEPLDTEPGVPAHLHRMPDKEVRDFISRCVRALRSHQSDFRYGPAPDEALGAFESVLALLLEVREIYPLRRGDIDLALSRFGYPVAEN